MGLAHIGTVPFSSQTPPNVCQFRDGGEARRGGEGGEGGGGGGVAQSDMVFPNENLWGKRFHLFFFHIKEY